MKRNNLHLVLPCQHPLGPPPRRRREHRDAGERPGRHRAAAASPRRYGSATKRRLDPASLGNSDEQIEGVWRERGLRRLSAPARAGHTVRDRDTLAFAPGSVNGYVFNRRWTFVAHDSLRARVLYLRRRPGGRGRLDEPARPALRPRGRIGQGRRLLAGDPAGDGLYVRREPPLAFADRN